MVTSLSIRSLLIKQIKCITISNLQCNWYHTFLLGKLGGIVKPNDGACHLDSKGVYTHSSDLDYPSVSQINHKVKENSVNIIFAITEEQFNVYELLQQNVEGSSVGTLSNDSSNIVNLVKEQYQVKYDQIQNQSNRN